MKTKDLGKTDDGRWRVFAIAFRTYHVYHCVRRPLGGQIKSVHSFPFEILSLDGEYDDDDDGDDEDDDDGDGDGDDHDHDHDDDDDDDHDDD